MFDYADADRFVRSANIPPRFRGLTFSDLSPYRGEDIGNAMGWRDSVLDGDVIMADGKPTAGKGLLYIGAPGHGKTTLAVTLAQDLARAVRYNYEAFGIPEGVTPGGRQVYYVSYPEMLEMAKRQFSDRTTEEEDRVLAGAWGHLSPSQNVKVLILDDLGREHRTASGWAENYFDNLLRKRYDLGLPTVVTSNVPRKEWADVYGERMASFAKEAFTARVIISPEGDRR